MPDAPALFGDTLLVARWELRPGATLAAEARTTGAPAVAHAPRRRSDS